MSTKIPTGFQLRSRDLRQVLDELAIAQKKATEILVGREATFVANTAVEFIDQSCLVGFPGPRALPKPFKASPIRMAWDKLDDRQVEVRKTRMRDPDVDFEVVYRIWLSRDTGTFIGYVRGEGADEFVQLLLDVDVAERYEYWNNTDPKDGISQQDWDVRGVVWSNAFAGRSGPWMDISIDVPPTLWRVSPAVLAAIPSFEQRVQKHAEEQAFTIWAAPYLAAMAAEENGSDIANPFRLHFEFRRKLRNADEEVRDIFLTTEAAVRARLETVITEAMLSARTEIPKN